MKLYALFISYRFGNHYCGVHTSLENLHGAVKELARDIEVPLSEVPKLKEIRSCLEAEDDMWHEFSVGTWVQIQEVSPHLVDLIVKAVLED